MLESEEPTPPSHWERRGMPFNSSTSHQQRMSYGTGHTPTAVPSSAVTRSYPGMKKPSKKPDNDTLEVIKVIKSLTPLEHSQNFNAINADSLARDQYLFGLMSHFQQLMHIEPVMWEQMIAAEEHMLEHGDPELDKLSPMEHEDVVKTLNTRLK